MIQHVCLAQCTLFLFSHAKCFCGPYSIRATEGGIGKYETPRGDGNLKEQIAGALLDNWEI